jgi:uncharacterized protein (TIGR02246 family)
MVFAAIMSAALCAQESAKTPKREAPAKAQPKAEAKAQPKAEAKDQKPDPLADALRNYSATFAKNDAKALAALWTEQGVHLDRETGERTAGRAALEADFEKLFKESAGARLTAEVTGKRMIRPDVAAIEGVARVIFPGAEPAESAFTAIMVKEGDTWLIDSVEEISPPTPATARDGLAELEWMIGHWVDQSESARVDTTVRWGAGESFLVRSFVAELEDGETRQGTQVIGWDPRLGQIRSWSFFDDGSFGEAYWSKNGDEWLVKSSQTLADGTIASGTQVIQRIDDNTLTVQMIGRELEGEPAPSEDPITVVRAPEVAAEPEASAESDTPAESGQAATPGAKTP